MTESSEASDELSLRVGRVDSSLRERAAQVLRRAILEFRFQPGDRLIERDLIEQTGVSRTTIREVLRELATEGLVTTIPQRGVEVVSLSEEDVADLYEVRAVLESFVGRSFAERATDEDIVGLREGYDEVARALGEAKNIQERLDAKDRFYQVMFGGCGNTAVASLLGGLQARTRLARARSLSQAGRLADTLAELEAIVTAIEGRDGDAAAAACVHHIMRSAQAAKLQIRALEGTDETVSA